MATDPRVLKLAHVIGDRAAAEKLVAAGLDTPRKVMAAPAERLAELEVVETVARLRPALAGELQAATAQTDKVPRTRKAKAG